MITFDGLSVDPYELRRLEVRGTDSLLRFALTVWLGDTLPSVAMMGPFLAPPATTTVATGAVPTFSIVMTAYDEVLL